jgi:hypothetical protein
MKLLNIKSSAFPNGDYKTYSFGMPKPELLPHNHPVVQAMAYQRAVNEFNGCKSALRQAKRIINKVR